jgi:hypothetical protein
MKVKFLEKVTLHHGTIHGTREPYTRALGKPNF